MKHNFYEEKYKCDKSETLTSDLHRSLKVLDSSSKAEINLSDGTLIEIQLEKC